MASIDTKILSSGGTNLILLYKNENIPILRKGYRDSAGRDCMIVGFTNAFAISFYHQYSCELESR